MNEFDARVFDLLDVFTPEPHRWPDWPDVVRRAHTRRMHRIVVAVAAAIIVLGSAAGVTAALGGFHAWLSGSPGKPAPKADQQKLASFGFPADTKLRELLRTKVDGKVYVLLGFRSGKSLCLRLKAVSLGHALGPTCAPAARVIHATAPIVPVVGVGGFEDSHAQPSAAVSYGIAADGLARVIIHAVDGDHRARLGGNAYLWVQNEPNTGQRALRVTAVASDGTRATLHLSRLGGPFAIELTPRRSARGPKRVQRTIAHPTVGWYIRGEKRGIGLNQVNPLPSYGAAAVGDTPRMIKPDPDSNARVGLAGHWCLLLLQYPDAGPATSCSPGRDFWSLGPMNIMLSSEGDRFVRIAGVAADGVQRVVVFLADGQRQQADFRDNLFTTLIAVAQLPAKVVAYDASDRVVGIETPLWFQPRVATGALKRLRAVFRVRGPHGAVAVGRLGRRIGGYRCWRVDVSTGRSPGACLGQIGGGPSVWVDLVQPAGRDLFVIGHARGPVARVQLEFTNGDRLRTDPVGGLFVFAIPRLHLRRDREFGLVRGYTSSGVRVQRQGIVFKVR